MFDVDGNKKYYVVGVVSNGDGCGKPGVGGVYTPVSNYIKWIEDTATSMM